MKNGFASQVPSRGITIEKKRMHEFCKLRVQSYYSDKNQGDGSNSALISDLNKNGKR